MMPCLPSSTLPAIRWRAEIVSENGHGCGHNLLGAGALGAAVAVKDYMQAHGLKGCPLLWLPRRGIRLRQDVHGPGRTL
ncbi:MAG: hypothetical protein V8Q30_06770 [Acutalibacteraceae bacterium]